MGETQKPIEHVHRIDAEQFADILEIFAPQAPTPLAQTPYDLGLEPWTFVDPQQKTEVVAYLDDRNQLRHVPTTRATEVPKAWRRVWLESRG